LSKMVYLKSLSAWALIFKVRRKTVLLRERKRFKKERGSGF